MSFDVIDDDDGEDDPSTLCANSYQCTKSCDKCGQWLDAFYQLGHLSVCPDCYYEMISETKDYDHE